MNYNTLPKISAIIPTYNSHRFIIETIESLLNQTQELDEIIIVDDNSSDDTYELLREKYYKFNKYIKVYKTSKNKGPSAARNIGINIANGDLVLFMDHDDIAESDLVESEYNRLLDLKESTDQNWVLVHSAYLEIDQEGISTNNIHRWKQVGHDEILGYEFVRNHILTTSGVLVDKKIILDVGGFNEDVMYSQDWELWLRLSQIGGFGYINKPLIKIRRHDKNTSRNIRNFINDEKNILKKYSLSFIEKAINKRNLPYYINKLDFTSILIRLGHWDKVYEISCEITCNYPFLDKGYFYLGLYYLHNNQYEDAEKQFQKVIKLNPNHAAALNNLAGIMIIQNDFEKARNILEDLIEKLSNYLDAKHNIDLINNRIHFDTRNIKFTWRELRNVLLTYSE